jgi:hypothetical protein
MEDLYDATLNETEDTPEAKSEEYDESVAEDNADPVSDGLPQDTSDGIEVDYEALIASDVASLKAEFPELAGIKDVTDLNNPLRYAALRDLGLTPAEAYMATAKRSGRDTRSHLVSARGRSMAQDTGMMSQLELATARDLFPGRSDSELQRLYKRVTK